MLAMQMLRRGDEHGVDGFVFEHEPVIKVGLDAGDARFGQFQLRGVDVRDGDEFGIGAIDRFLCDLGAAVAIANDGHTDRAH